MSRRRLMSSQEPRQIGVGNAPALSDVDGAKRACLDPLPNRGFGHFKPVGNFLNRLIAILRHGLPLFAV